MEMYSSCLLYTSDAADDLLCVDLGGRRIIKKNMSFEYIYCPYVLENKRKDIYEKLVLENKRKNIYEKLVQK